MKCVTTRCDVFGLEKARFPPFEVARSSLDANKNRYKMSIQNVIEIVEFDTFCKLRVAQFRDVKLSW